MGGFGFMETCKWRLFSARTGHAVTRGNPIVTIVS